MKRMHHSSVALMLSATLHGGCAPTILSSGIATPPEPDKARSQQLKGRLQDEVDLLRSADPSGRETNEARRVEMTAFFGRMSGRFRIDGRIEQVTALETLGGKITGVADCSGVGDGPGVHCILNATWQAFDTAFGDRYVAGVPPSELLNTFRPAVLVLGLDPDQRQVQSLLVTADSRAYGMLGKLIDNTLSATNWDRCEKEGELMDHRCFRRIEIVAEPESDVVELLLLARNGRDLRFTMHRDADARASNPLKPMKAR